MGTVLSCVQKRIFSDFYVWFWERRAERNMDIVWFWITASHAEESAESFTDVSPENRCFHCIAWSLRAPELHCGLWHWQWESDCGNPSSDCVWNFTGSYRLVKTCLDNHLDCHFFWFGDKVPGKDCTSDASSSVEFRSMPCFYAHKVSCIENIGMQHWPNFSPSLMHFNCLIMISGMFQHYLHVVPPQFPTDGVEACNSHKRFDHLHGVLVSSETWVNLQLWNRSVFFCRTCHLLDVDP